MERLWLIKNQKSSVLDIPEFGNIVNYIRNLFPFISNSNLLILLDHFRLIILVLISHPFVEIGNKKQGYVLKRCLRKIAIICMKYNFVLTQLHLSKIIDLILKYDIVVRKTTKIHKT